MNRALTRTLFSVCLFFTACQSPTQLSPRSQAIEKNTSRETSALLPTQTNSIAGNKRELNLSQKKHVVRQNSNPSPLAIRAIDSIGSKPSQDKTSTSFDLKTAESVPEHSEVIERNSPLENSKSISHMEAAVPHLDTTIEASTNTAQASAQPTPNSTASSEENLPTPVMAQSQNINLTGGMKIDFGSRKNVDGIDTYSLDLLCADTIRISGKIVRTPRIVSAILSREKSPLNFQYNLKLLLKNPAEPNQEIPAGNWTGTLNMTSDGKYYPTTLAIKSALPAQASPVSGYFSGSLQGKKESQSHGLSAKIREYTRIISGKKIALKVQRADPLRFDDLVLSAGPSARYPATRVSGNLDYDYDTGNWLTQGITINPESGSKDVVTGSIKWMEDPQRHNNGKGQYQFNLRFNESQNAAAQDESSFFGSASDEEAFFFVDSNIPTLSGTISYVDQFAHSADASEPTVVSSTVTYNLQGHKLSKEQLLSFIKLWLLIVGPVNDE